MTKRSQQRWFVTGASSGFGKEIVRAVVAQGGQVFATARNPADLADLVQQGEGGVFAHALDVTDPDAIKAAVKAAHSAMGGIDVLVNNAGYGMIDSIEESDEAALRTMFEVNFFGLANLTRAVLPGMRGQRRGWVINISSIGGRTTVPGGGYYSATKYAVEALSDALRRETAHLGIGVTVIEPGAFRTDFAGRSLVVGPPGAMDYAESVGTMKAALKAYDGKQPGDPARAAAAIVAAVDSDTPPHILVLGKAAVDIIADVLKTQTAELEQWRDLSVSTDFPE